MAIKKDEAINCRDVIVTLMAWEVVELIRNKALAEAGIVPNKATEVKVDLSMKSRDGMGYERDTESLAEGARVRIMIDYTKPTIEDEVEVKDPPGPFDGFGPAIGGPSVEAKPEPKRDRSGRIKD